MLNVVCLNHRNYLKQGELYVSRLRNMVDRNLTIPHKFICLTEQDLPEREGWWAKLDLVQKSFRGWTMYLDLDVVITRNIDAVVRAAFLDPGRLWMRDDFSYSIVNPKKGLDEQFKRYLGGDGCCNSSVMIFYDTVDLSGLDESMLTTMHGDQNVLSHLLWPHRIGLLPADLITSYKYHVLEGKDRGAICVFHGEPKPHQVKDSWVQDHWR